MNCALKSSHFSKRLDIYTDIKNSASGILISLLRQKGQTEKIKLEKLIMLKQGESI
ncbi:MAG: hypothetical protein KBC00_02565 [Candidatus Levybacteria bacterium]|nr:hypothetical protein [Candidatus Levybacteria bacterium]MBP9815012.1 hypothetical protein [Candidatus Levybacteria bacterium]